jgi:hypothetical protein
MHSLEETAGDVGGRYAWSDLGLLHGQILAAPPFNSPIASGAARHLAKQGDSATAAAGTAVAAVSIIAALVGIFATGGMAAALAVVGAAASGAQAGMSIAEYNKLADLRAARTGDTKHDLVDSEVVGAAKAQAILDTIFAFLDTVQAVKAIRSLGGAAAVAEDLGNFAQLEPARKAEVLSAAMQSMGEPMALDAVGGIQAARGQVGGSRALARAERYSNQLAGEIAERLGSNSEAREAMARQVATGAEAVPVRPPAPRPPEELLEEARRIAAEQTGLPRERALEVVCPHVADPQGLAAMLERAAATAEKLSEEYRALTTPAERIGFVHRKACDVAKGRMLPAPGMDIGATNHFHAPSWTIVYASGCSRRPRPRTRSGSTCSRSACTSSSTPTSTSTWPASGSRPRTSEMSRRTSAYQRRPSRRRSGWASSSLAWAATRRRPGSTSRFSGPPTRC